jgi:hypothetical protein
MAAMPRSGGIEKTRPGEEIDSLVFVSDGERGCYFLEQQRRVKIAKEETRHARALRMFEVRKVSKKHR